MSLLKGLSVVSVPVTDWAKAKAFYHDTLGLPIALDIGEVGWCEFGEAGKTTFAISLWRDATPPVRGGTIPVFAVDDCAKAVGGTPAARRQVRRSRDLPRHGHLCRCVRSRRQPLPDRAVTRADQRLSITTEYRSCK